MPTTLPCTTAHKSCVGRIPRFFWSRCVSRFREPLSPRFTCCGNSVLLVVSTVWDCSTGVRNEQGEKSESWLSQDHPYMTVCLSPQQQSSQYILQAPKQWEIARLAFSTIFLLFKKEKNPSKLKIRVRNINLNGKVRVYPSSI